MAVSSNPSLPIPDPSSYRHSLTKRVLSRAPSSAARRDGRQGLERILPTPKPGWRSSCGHFHLGPSFDPMALEGRGC